MPCVGKLQAQLPHLSISEKDRCKEPDGVKAVPEKTRQGGSATILRVLASRTGRGNMLYQLSIASFQGKLAEVFFGQVFLIWF
jgi:hypothetical protein